MTRYKMISIKGIVITLVYALLSIMPVFILAQSISIVSWNIKDFGQSRDDDEIRMIAEVIKDADIVAIQEVVAIHPGGSQAVARLADLLNRMGSKWDYKISDPTRSPSPHISERYAFLWKTSKVAITGGGPRLVSEVATEVNREPYLIHFKVGHEVLALLNYHACTHENHFPERAEIKSISDWLIKQPFQNVVWAGDMNLVIEDIAFIPIRNAGYKSALKGEKTSLKTTCVGGHYLSRAEDNILYKLSSLSFTDGQVLDYIAEGDCDDVSWKRDSYSDHLGVQIIMSKSVNSPSKSPNKSSSKLPRS